MYAFARCTALTNVVFEDEGSMVMTERLVVGIGAFQECTSLKSVKFSTTLGNSVMSMTGGKTGIVVYTTAAIAENAFKDCRNLTTVTFPSDTSNINVAMSAFDGTQVRVPDEMLVPGSSGTDYGGGKADWQDGGSNLFGIDGCLICKDKAPNCTKYNPHKGIFV